MSLPIGFELNHLAYEVKVKRLKSGRSMGNRLAIGTKFRDCATLPRGLITTARRQSEQVKEGEKFFPRTFTRPIIIPFGRNEEDERRRRFNLDLCQRNVERRD